LFKFGNCSNSKVVPIRIFFFAIFLKKIRFQNLFRF
jgi:hypothetical protein